MKPTNEQIEVIKGIANTISWWEHTNDINSPSHFSDIDEWIRNNPLIDLELEDKLEELGLTKLIALQIEQLLYLVRKIK